MKLIKQTSLEFREGKSDKVYEVDLCEMAEGQYVVNFRFGRRGKALREGTKTKSPVSLDKAETLYDELVESKTSKGYQLAASGGGTPGEVPEGDDVPAGMNDAWKQAILKRLQEGTDDGTSWRLSRVVWRAGELGIVEAIPLIAGLVGKSDEFLDYSIAWSLGRFADAQGVPVLTELAGGKRDDKTKRMARFALTQIACDERQQLLGTALQSLPTPLDDLAFHGPAEAFSEALKEHIADGELENCKDLEAVYLLNHHHVRPGLLEVIRTVPLVPSYFQQLRHIYKAAEMRRDAQVFGILAHRFEVHRPNFTMMDSWYYSYSSRKKPTLGTHAEKAFSKQTREYFRRRNWRSIHRLGEADDLSYVNMAVGVLLAFTDEDAQPVRAVSRYDWDTYRASNYRTLNTINTHYDRFGNYWAFNQILYRNSSRYEADPGRNGFCCKPGYNPGDAGGDSREEAYPKLWNQVPGALLHLLDESRCEPVHQFAVRAVRANPEFLNQLEMDALLMLLQAPYEITAQLGFELAVGRYDAKNPDLELVYSLANCPVAAARQQAYSWINDQSDLFFSNIGFVLKLIMSPEAETREYIRNGLRRFSMSEDQSRDLIAHTISHLMNVEADEALAADVIETLNRLFSVQLQTIGEEVLRDLLGHPLVSVQEFAGDLLLNHQTLSTNPPADILDRLLHSEQESLRGIGVRLLGQLPDDTLKANIDLLVNLSRHELLDIRQNIRGVVKRLAEGDANFGAKLAEKFIAALLVPGAPEGVPSHTARVIQEDLGNCLGGIPAETVWKLLNSRSGPAQQIGGLLLPTNVPVDSITVSDLVRLANHEILSVREASWNIARNHSGKLEAELGEATRLLDSKWEDSRAVAFELFQAFPEGTLTPATIISICDSVRADVQQFGRGLLTRLFERDSGEEYVLKLSEHPSTDMQLFVSNFLNEYVRGNLAHLREMKHYFLSVLCRVNRSRVAKDRVLDLLESEAEASEEAATLIAGILARQSATNAIGDKSRLIRMMVDMQTRYPEIRLPIQLLPVEVRDGV